MWPVSHIRRAARGLCRSLFCASNLQMTLCLVICSRLCSTYLLPYPPGREDGFHITNSCKEWQKAAVLFPVVLSSENIQLHMLILTCKQALRDQEGISWKCCAASTLFAVLNVFHNRTEFIPQLVLFTTRYATLRYPRLGRQAQLRWVEDRPDCGPLPRPCLSSGTCLRSGLPILLTTHTINLQFSKSLSQMIRLSLAEQGLQGLAGFPPTVQTNK